jgi:hypothetical protein
MPISPSLARFDARIILYLLIYILSLMGMGSVRKVRAYSVKEIPILKRDMLIFFIEKEDHLVSLPSFDPLLFHESLFQSLQYAHLVAFVLDEDETIGFLLGGQIL